MIAGMVVVVLLPLILPAAGAPMGKPSPHTLLYTLLYNGQGYSGVYHFCINIILV